MISILMKMLLYVPPKMRFRPEEMVVYDQLISTIYESPITAETLTFPKHRFLQYLASKGDFVFHGSNHVAIDVFEPRPQTLFNGKVTKAVFATTDPIWSMFYAVFDRKELVGSFRNGCFEYKNKKYHYYSLNQSTMENRPWTSGKLYILPKNKFTVADNRKVSFDEWICHDLVKPINHLEVSAEDFYYIHKVATHQADESLLKTWLLYKIRTLKAKRIRAR